VVYVSPLGGKYIHHQCSNCCWAGPWGSHISVVSKDVIDSDLNECERKPRVSIVYEPRSKKSNWQYAVHQVMARICYKGSKSKATSFAFAFDMTNNTDDDFRMSMRVALDQAIIFALKVRADWP
jgi:hypothetical protein